jgi:phenylpyruvate tautomerase PptA (4-oxalocrotonate tautomerase family)
MPVWQIYCPQHAFNDEEKRDLAGRITGMYAGFLPRFYVNVLFRPVPSADFFLGGEPVDDFVHLAVDHIARSIEDPANQRLFTDRCIATFTQFFADRGLRWELHVDNTPFNLWTINGLIPPAPGSEAEAKWRLENRPSAYEMVD